MNKRTFYNTFLNRHYGKKIRTAFDACLFLKNDKISLETKTLEPACFDHLSARCFDNKLGLSGFSALGTKFVFEERRLCG